MLQWVFQPEFSRQTPWGALCKYLSHLPECTCSFQVHYDNFHALLSQGKCMLFGVMMTAAHINPSLLMWLHFHRLQENVGKETCWDFVSSNMDPLCPDTSHESWSIYQVITYTSVAQQIWTYIVLRNSWASHWQRVWFIDKKKYHSALHDALFYPCMHPASIAVWEMTL